MSWKLYNLRIMQNWGYALVFLIVVQLCIQSVVSQSLSTTSNTTFQTITFTLCPECTAVYILNIQQTKTISVKINQTNPSVELAQISLLENSTDSKTLSQTQTYKRIEIFNYETTAQTINMTIIGGKLLDVLVQTEIKQPDFTQAVLLVHSNISDLILPFNLIDDKNKRIVVEQSETDLVPTNYTYEPFLDTYWNEYGQNALILSWLPYFSRCQYKTSRRISISDVINPWIDNNYELSKVAYLCNSTYSWFWGEGLQCSNKQMITKCVLQQLYVQKVKKQYWWKNKQQPLFYFIKSSLLNKSLQIFDNPYMLSVLMKQYYNSLIPLTYKTYFNVQNQTPNQFILSFEVASIDDITKIQILKASLQARYDQSIANYFIKGEIQLQIYVKYLSHFDTLVAYGKEPVAYALIFLVLMLLILGTLGFIFYIAKVKLFLVYIFKLIIYPVTKGFIFAIFLFISFLSLFMAIATTTNYRVIATNFDGLSTGTEDDYYSGRLGLSVFLVGYFLLGTGISQSFKILTVEQTNSMIEDDLTEKHCPGMDSPQPQKIEQQSAFIIKNMNSHRKYLLTYTIAYTFPLLLLYYAQLNFNFLQKILFVLLGYPFINKMTILIYRHLIICQLLYLSAILITLQVFLDLMIISDTNMWETIVFYFVKLFSQNVLCIAVEIFGEWAAVRVNAYVGVLEQALEPSRVCQLLANFKNMYQDIANQSRYQKTFFYCNMLLIRFAAVLTRSFLIILVTITIRYNSICSDLNQGKQNLIKSFILLICFIPIDMLMITLGVNIFQNKFGLQIFKCLEFNRFKFKKRKGRWINDLFHQGRSIQYFYREFEKFCFSSQMYLLIFIVSFALLTIIIGLKIILQVKYVSFIDPVMLVILLIVWMTGNLLSIIISFLAIKFKIYERKEGGKMRSKLENVEKILKKTNYSEYLQTEAVKNYFLLHCREWIITNLTKIFDKEDFTENNYEFLIKYKHYKSLLKKKKIEERKMISGDNDGKIKQILAEENKDKKIVIKFPRKDFQELAKPLISSWLYIAKQFVFLKSLVSKLKEICKKDSCELCSMNIELEVIEKREFSTIVNEYRVMNVGRRFNQKHFVEFYKHEQEYITLCIECKDRKLYIEKKNLDVNGSPRKILQKWLILARSNILHRKKISSKTTE